jgi:hypothetical protein
MNNAPRRDSLRLVAGCKEIELNLAYFYLTAALLHCRPMTIKSLSRRVVTLAFVIRRTGWAALSLETRGFALGSAHGDQRDSVPSISPCLR